MKIIALFEDPEVIKKILTHLEEKPPESARTRLPPSSASPQLGLFA